MGFETPQVIEHGSGAFTSGDPACTMNINGAPVDSYAGRWASNGDVIELLASASVAAPATVEIICGAARGMTFESQRLIATGVSSVAAWI